PTAFRAVLVQLQRPARTTLFPYTTLFRSVEGEVYALSSFFTAVVFWAILKWESEALRPHSTRWLILIAYLMGLSIGVHLLNLLRSEEHTSELQSRENLVCRLLLEKKKRHH